MLSANEALTHFSLAYPYPTRFGHMLDTGRNASPGKFLKHCIQQAGDSLQTCKFHLSDTESSIGIILSGRPNSGPSLRSSQHFQQHITSFCLLLYNPGISVFMAAMQHRPGISPIFFPFPWLLAEIFLFHFCLWVKQHEGGCVWSYAQGPRGKEH